MNHIYCHQLLKDIAVVMKLENGIVNIFQGIMLKIIQLEFIVILIQV